MKNYTITWAHISPYDETVILSHDLSYTDYNNAKSKFDEMVKEKALGDNVPEDEIDSLYRTANWWHHTDDEGYELEMTLTETEVHNPIVFVLACEWSFDYEHDDNVQVFDTAEKALEAMKNDVEGWAHENNHEGWKEESGEHWHSFHEYGDWTRNHIAWNIYARDVE